MIRFQTALVAILWVPLFLLLDVRVTAAEKAAPLVIGETFTTPRSQKVRGRTRQSRAWARSNYESFRQTMH